MKFRARFVEVEINEVETEVDPAYVSFYTQDGETRRMRRDTFETVYVPILSTTAEMAGDLG